MKKITLTALAITLSISVFAQAQVDVQAGYGIMPVSACKGSFRQVATVEAALSRTKGGKQNKLEYTLDLGVNLGTPPADLNGIPSQAKSDSAGEILMGIRYLWTDKAVALYSGAALGTELRRQTSGRGSLLTPGLAYHITAIGIRAERKKFIFSGELGVGHLGLLRIGIGYRF